MEHWLFRLCLAAVVLAPLPFGANRPWAWEALAAVFAAAMIGQAGIIVLGRARAVAAVPLGPLILWGAALAWAGAQVTDLAPPVRPDLWAQAAEALGHAVPARAVLDVEAARAVVLRLLTYTAAFWLFAQAAASRRRAVEILAGIAWAGVAYGVLGVLLLAAGDRLPFAEKVQHLGVATGPFPNRNTFALWLGLSGCALLVAGVQRDVWRTLSRGWAWWLGAGVVAVALLATQSRAGIVAAMLGVAVTAARLSRPRLALVVVGVVALGVLLSPVSIRLAATGLTPEAMPRLTVWATTLDGIARAPWTGIGPGAFPDAFAELRPRSLLQPWHYAHNSYLELAWTLGLPAAVCAVAALAWGGVILWRSSSTTAAAALGGLVAAGVHGLVDFSPQIPAVALLLAVLLGSGCGRAGAPREVRQRPPSPAAGPPTTPAPPDPAPAPSPPP